MRRRSWVWISALLSATLTGSFVFASAGAASSPRRVLWVARYVGGPPNLIDEAKAVAVSPDGSTVFITGRSDGQYNDYATIAYDAASGAQRWVSRYDSPEHRSDAAYALAVNPDGSTVFVTGYTNDQQADFTTIAYDAATGSDRWIAQFDGPAHEEDIATALAVSPDGSTVYVAGRIDGPLELADYGTVAYDAITGVQLWEARYDGPGGSYDSINALGVSPDGSTVFVTGYGWGPGALTVDYTTIAYDAGTGSERWLSRHDSGGDDVAVSLAVSPDGTGVFVTGRSDGSGSSDDYATIAYEADTGAQAWLSEYDGPGSANDVAKAVRIAPDGSTVFVTGVSDGADEDYATVAYEAASGVEQWVARLDTGAHDTATALGVGPGGRKVFVTGYGGEHSDYLTVAYNATTGGRKWVSRVGQERVIDAPNALAVSSDGSKVFITGGVLAGPPFYYPDYGTIALAA